MKARINEKCDGSGLCADICPEVFEIGQNGKAHIKVNTVPQAVQDSCKDAEQSCPFQAIEIEE